ncbi:MAG: flagellin lysine-N-methylase [Eubacterium sp.]|nr:flagellin lysine-N-methylase [Eubacterium sp.]
MKLVTPSFYKDFKCIAGACPDSCCQGWEVDADEASLAYYKTLSGDIRERIDSVLDKDEFGNTIFRLAEKKRCPFLNHENLCDMHIAIGGEHTPYTCRTFPRFINDFGGTREMGISFSCPVASEMMWNLNGKFDFAFEINDLPPSLNDIDAELYFKLLNERKKAYSIVQNNDLTIKERLIQLLDFGLSLQKDVDDYKEGSGKTSFFDVFDNPEVINPEWVEKVKNHKTSPEVLNTQSSENIAMYFLFRYFLTAVYDSDVLSKIKMAVIGVLIPAYFGNDAWTMHLWSKETEHSDINMSRYKNELRNNFYLSVDELKKHLI